jgi:hypothetical protein
MRKTQDLIAAQADEPDHDNADKNTVGLQETLCLQYGIA